MGQNIDIARRAVGIGEDERNLVVIDARTVAAHLLIRTGRQVKEFLIDHHLKEFTGLFRHLLIHLQGSCCQLIQIPVRFRIAGFEVVADIIVFQSIDTDAPGLSFS